MNIKKVIKTIRHRWWNIHPSDLAIPIVTKDNATYWIELQENHPNAIFISHKGKWCGIMRMLWDKEHLDLADISVFEKYRGHGLGTAMLQWLIDYARQEKMLRITARVSPEKISDFERLMNWYLRHGFQRESTNSHSIFLSL